MTKGLEGCLYVLPKEKFAAMSGNLEKLPLEHKANRDYGRLFFSGASEEAVDKQGRMNIPGSLREYASLSKEVVVVGVSGRGEIWDKQKWQQYQQAVEGDYASIAEQLDL